MVKHNTFNIYNKTAQSKGGNDKLVSSNKAKTPSSTEMLAVLRRTESRRWMEVTAEVSMVVKQGFKNHNIPGGKYFVLLLLCDDTVQLPLHG